MTSEELKCPGYQPNQVETAFSSGQNDMRRTESYTVNARMWLQGLKLAFVAAGKIMNDELASTFLLAE